MIWHVAACLLETSQDAEDVFQATFLLLVRKAPRLQGRQSIAGWLYETARRLALKARSMSARRLRRESQTRPSSPNANPLDQLSVREAQAILSDELDRLPNIYREPVLLCLCESLAQDEAARRIGC
jgi:RNA polymerase sigma factor (sigma-70 family)